MDMKKFLSRPAIAVTHKGTTYEMRVAGYQFETLTEDHCSHDRNWLNIALRVKNDQRDAVGIEASLLAWELGPIADDLEYFLEHKEEKYYEPYFTEDDIRFKLWRTGKGEIKMDMHYSMWAHMSDTDKSEFFHFGGALTEKDLRRAIKVLRLYQDAFPIRD